jgi:hypothetical protein
MVVFAAVVVKLTVAVIVVEVTTPTMLEEAM